MCRYESPSHTGRWTHKNREDDSQTHLLDHLAGYLVDWQDLRGLPSLSATDTHPDWSPVILPVWIHTPSILGRTCHTNQRLTNLSISNYSVKIKWNHQTKNKMQKKAGIQSKAKVTMKLGLLPCTAKRSLLHALIVAVNVVDSTLYMPTLSELGLV